MRAGGARVGVDELLAAHRALAAVDPADREPPTSRCGPRCARGATTSPRSTPPSPSGSRRRAERPDAPELLDEVASLVLPRVAVPAAGPGSGRSRTPRSCPPPGRTSSCCATRTSPTTPTPSAARARAIMRRLAGAAPDAAEPPHAPGAPPRGSAARRAPGPAPHDPRVAAHRRRPVRAPLARARRAAAPARAGLRRVRLDGALRAHAAPVHAGLRAARRRVEAFVFGTRLTRVTAELAGAIPTARWTAPPAPPRLVRRHAHRRGAGHAQPRARPPAGARRDRGPALRRLGPRRARAARGRDGAAGALRPPLVWLNPLKAHPAYEPLTRACRPRCRTWTISWPGTRWPRWRSWPQLMDGAWNEPGGKTRRRERAR